MNPGHAVANHAAPSEGEEQPGRGQKISIEDLEQREQRRDQDQLDDPLPAQQVLQGVGGGEGLIGKLPPRMSVADDENDGAIEHHAHHQRSQNRPEEPRERNSGLASSAHLATDSKPVMK